MIPVPSLSVALSTHRAAARPVVLTLRLQYEMQCGWPGPGSLAIRLPSAMVVPATLAGGSVRVDGALATSASIHGHEADVALPPRPRIMCDEIGPGTLTVSFSRAARLGNPKAPGSYALQAQHGAVSVAGRITIA